MSRPSSILSPASRLVRPYHPRVIAAKTRLWCDETTPVDANTWGDRSGGGHTLTRVAGTITTAMRRGRRFMVFDGATYLKTANFTSTTPCEYWLAVRLLVPGYLLSGTGGSSNFLATTSTTNRLVIGVRFGATVNFDTAETVFNRWVVINARSNGASTLAWLDRTQVATHDVPGAGAQDGVCIGADVTGYQPIVGQIGEVLQTDLLSATEAHSLRSYLVGKWSTRVERVVDYRATPTGIAYSLPGDMVLTSGVSTARTVQTSESTVVVGIPQYAGRIGRLAAAHARGLVLEGAATQRWTDPRGIPAVGGIIVAGTDETAALSGQPGVDGTGNVPEYDVLSGGRSRFLSQNGQPSVACVYSAWLQSSSYGPGDYQMETYNGTELCVVAVSDEEWQRVSLVRSANAARQVIPVDASDQRTHGGIDAVAQIVRLDLVNAVDAPFLGEAIQTAATRTAETHAEPLPLSRYLVDGRLLLGLRFRPRGARSAYLGTPYFWRVDAGLFARFAPATGIVTITAAGRTYSTATGITWAAGDTAVEIFFELSASANTRVRWRVNEGAIVDQSYTSAQDPVSTSPLYTLAAPSVDVLNCHLEVRHIGTTPAWAA